MNEQFRIRDKRASGRYYIDNELIAEMGAIIGVYGISVYNVLTKYANNETQTAFPSQRTIAKLIGCSRRQVIRAMDKLEKYRLIKRTGAEAGDGKRSHIVSLLHKDEWLLGGDCSLSEDSCDSQSPLSKDRSDPQSQLEETGVTHSPGRKDRCDSQSTDSALGVTQSPTNKTNTNNQTNNMNRTKEKEVEINFNLAPHAHSDLQGKLVFWKSGNTLHQAVVTKVMAKTLAFTVIETAEQRRCKPGGQIFYQNGGPGLAPVEVLEVDDSPRLTPDQLAIKNAMIDLMPSAEFVVQDKYKEAKRIKEIQESAIKAAEKWKASDFVEFGEWYRKVLWGDKESPPSITLETIRKNWTRFIEYKNGGNKKNGHTDSKPGGYPSGRLSPQQIAALQR